MEGKEVFGQGIVIHVSWQQLSHMILKLSLTNCYYHQLLYTYIEGEGFSRCQIHNCKVKLSKTIFEWEHLPVTGRIRALPLMFQVYLLFVVPVV